MSLRIFEKLAARANVGDGLRRLWRRDAVQNAVIFLLMAGPVLLVSAEAHAAGGGFGQWIGKAFGNFVPDEAAMTTIASGVGGVGTMVSGYKCWENFQDGAQLKDYKGSLLAIIPCSGLLSYGMFKTVIAATGAG